MSALYLPDGTLVDIKTYRIQRAINEYDERLFLGLKDGQLTVFVRMPYPDDPWPVFGLGVFNGELPEPADVVRRIAQADTARRGSEILDRVNKGNARIKVAKDNDLLDARRDVYERLEHALRSTGHSPGFQSFRARSRG